ncbi:MAG: ABC transporter substrate-binding protein, partial [Bacteroidota bacterium]
MTRISFLFGCLGILFGCTPAPQGAATVPGINDSTIVLGAWAPLSGPAALWGNLTKAMDAYFHHVNESGGVHGRKIKFIYKDDQYNPSRTVAIVRQLDVEEEVFAFIGGIGTAPGRAVMDYIIDRQIPWVSPCSGATYWAYPPRKNIFATFPLIYDEAHIQIEYVLHTLKKQRIGIIYQNDDFGKSALLSASEALKGAGLDWQVALPLNRGENDLGPLTARMKEAKVEVVLIWTMPGAAASLLKQAELLRFSPDWIACSALSDMRRMYELTEGAWEGVTFGYYGKMATSGDPVMEQYKQALAAYHPQVSWGGFAASGFMFAEPLVEGLRKAGKDLTRESFIQAMESLKGYQGIGPAFTFGPGQRQGHRSLFLVRCQDATRYE